MIKPDSLEDTADTPKSTKPSHTYLSSSLPHHLKPKMMTVLRIVRKTMTMTMTMTITMTMMMITCTREEDAAQRESSRRTAPARTSSRQRALPCNSVISIIIVLLLLFIIIIIVLFLLLLIIIIITAIMEKDV